MRLKNLAKEPIELLSKLLYFFMLIIVLGYIAFVWLRFPIYQLTNSFDLSAMNYNKIAHRGLFDNKRVPENSLMAFKNAIQRGCAIELDVMLSKDQEVMVFHDEDLTRMTGGLGQFEQWSFNDLKKLQLLNTPEKIPTLLEVLKLLQGQVPLHLEIKQLGKVGPLEEKVLGLLKNYSGTVCILSFNIDSLAWFKAHAPNFIRVLNLKTYWTFGELLKSIINVRPHMINFDISSLTPFGARVLNYFIPIGAYTIRDQAVYEKFKDVLHHTIFEDFK